MVVLKNIDYFSVRTTLADFEQFLTLIVVVILCDIPVKLTDVSQVGQ